MVSGQAASATNHTQQLCIIYQTDAPTPSMTNMTNFCQLLHVFQHTFFFLFSVFLHKSCHFCHSNCNRYSHGHTHWQSLTVHTNVSPHSNWPHLTTAPGTNTLDIQYTIHTYDTIADGVCVWPLTGRPDQQIRPAPYPLH